MDLSKRKDVRAALCLIGLILGISCVVYYKFIFGGYYFLSKDTWGSDLIRANIPAYTQMYDSFAAGGNFWSWKMGIGTSMFSHADAYFDPFTYIVFLLGRDGIPRMMVWMVIVKLVFEGLSIFSLLRYYRLNRWAAVFGAVTYSFCGYSLIVGVNVALGTILVYTPLVFLGIEKWLDGRRPWLLIVSLFLTCIYSVYYYYALGISAALYLALRLIQRRQPRKLIGKMACLACFGLLAVLLGAFSLLPRAELILRSTRVAGTSDVNAGAGLLMPDFKALATVLIRSVGNDWLGNPITNAYQGIGYMGVRDYFQLSSYSSAFFFVLLWYYLACRRRRGNALLAIAVTVVLILFPFFSFAFNSFSTINARWMFIISVAESVAIAFSLDLIIREKHVDCGVLIQGGAVTLVVLLASMAVLSMGHGGLTGQWGQYLDRARRFFLAVSVLYVGGLVLGAVYNRKDKLKGAGTAIVAAGVAGLMLVDIGLNYYHWYWVDPDNEAYPVGAEIYNDASDALIGRLRDEDGSFYRIHKNFDSVYDCSSIPSENDAMAQNYYGLQSYNSLNNPEYIEFLRENGIYVTIPFVVEGYRQAGIQPEDIVGPELNYIDGVENDFCLMDYLGVKYYMAKEGTAQVDEGYSLLYSDSGIEVYENHNAYPLAFVNPQVMPLQQFQSLTDQEKRAALLTHTVVDGAGEAEALSLQYTAEDIASAAQSRREAFSLTSFSEDQVVFDIHVAEDDAWLSFSVPYDKDWHVYVDGAEVPCERINVSLLGAKIDSAGDHAIVLKYVPRMFYLGGMAAAASWVVLGVAFIILSRRRTARRGPAPAGM